MQVQGGTMAMTDKQKARLEAAGIEAGIRYILLYFFCHKPVIFSDQFAKESLLRDEHEELKKYIDEGLRKIDGNDAVASSASSEVEVSIYPLISC